MPEVTINGVRYIPAPPTCENPALLDFEWDFRDVGKVRIRDFLRQLLTTLWDEGERFDAKWPWGNSGWQWDFYEALIAAKAIEGDIDVNAFGWERGDGNAEKAKAITIGLITEMCKPHPIVHADWVAAPN